MTQLFLDISLAEIMHTSDLKRWHLVNTVKSQTLAEHLFLVTVISVELARLANAPRALLLELVLEAMSHDLDELRSGDAPSPHKEASGQTTVPDDYVGHIVKIADAIEAFWWIYNNAIGVKRQTVVGDVFGRLLRRAKQATGTGWPELASIESAVDDVLKQLGLPWRIVWKGQIEP